MVRFIIVSIVNGFLLMTMDALINGNPLGRKLYEVYSPIARTFVSIPAGIIIDLIYGFILSLVFLLFYNSLLTENGIIKGISLAVIIWFFRVAMNVISSWITYTVPAKTLLYTLATGLIEMLVIGVVLGLFLRPFKFLGL